MFMFMNRYPPFISMNHVLLSAILKIVSCNRCDIFSFNNVREYFQCKYDVIQEKTRF
jgi:hypothetical protein